MSDSFLMDPRQENGKLRRDLSKVNSFIEMGKPLYIDPKGDFMIREGQIFEAQTVKGGKNIIVAMRVTVDGWFVYIHGDKAKKVTVEQFIRAVEYGELEPKLPQEVDVGRMSMAMIGIDAVANRRTGEEQLMIMGEDAEARYLQERG